MSSGDDGWSIVKSSRVGNELVEVEMIDSENDFGIVSGGTVRELVVGADVAFEEDDEGWRRLNPFRWRVE